jgi:tetratricopeptide (TPR) repeat protein
MRLRCTNRLVIWLSLLAALSLHLPSLSHAQQVGNIVGEVTVVRLGFPPKQIMVNLLSRGGNINSAYADDQGRFAFYSLPGGSYDLVIEDDEYAPLKQRVDLNPLISPVMYTRLSLIPRTEKTLAANSGRMAGSNRNVIDSKEYTRKFPKKAVKEYEKGVQAAGGQNSANAAKHFQKSIELAPGFYPAHNELGRIYMANSDFGAAQREFEDAIRLNQSDAEAHLNLGNVLLLTKKYDEALKSVQEGLRRDPNSALGEFVLGSVYERTGRFPEAERALRQALQLDPKLARVHLELVNLYMSQERKSEASAELKSFLRQFPTDPLAPKARQLLSKLQAAPN